MRNVSFTVTLSIAGQPKLTIGIMSIRNLKLTKDYKEAKAMQLPAPSSGSKQEASSSESAPGVLNENLRPVVGESEPADVKIEEH